MSWGDLAAWLGAFAGFIAIVASIWIAKDQARKAAAAALAERQDATLRALAESQEATRRASWSAALAAYQTYLELGVQHPEYASGEMSSLEKGYSWYLTVLCYAAEQILSPYCGPESAKQDWKRALGAQFDRHRHVLREALDKSLGQLGEPLNNFQP